MGRASGVTDEQLRGLANFQTNAAFSELEKLVVEYAERMTETPVEVSDALFARLRQHFNKVQIVELTAAIAWENYRARFDHALRRRSRRFFVRRGLRAHGTP